MTYCDCQSLQYSVLKTAMVLVPMRHACNAVAWLIILGCACAPTTDFARAAEKISPEQLAFFENKIRPVLAKNCYTCHSAEAKMRMGGLSLDTRDGVLRGGQRGDAVVPGSMEDSLLLSAISYETDLKMPPTGKLPDAVIADFEKWVEMGAPDPREPKVKSAESKIDIAKGREYWAFQAPSRPPTPRVGDISWPRGTIDHFILARLEKEGLTAVRDAGRRALIRRATFDLIGLPPTLEQIEAFENDPSGHAFRKVIDRLLGSPQFGERWGRHWLDLARYAETIGRTLNFPFPVAWRYRDYVIQSFNEDKPYDRFVSEQVAGDLLRYDTLEQRREQVIATGFLALGAHDLNEPDRTKFPMDVADEMINVTSRSLLALTVGCARCHDHKFDPIPTTDYYAMAGIFKSTELKDGLRQRAQFAAYFKAEKLLRLEGMPAYAKQEDFEANSEREQLWVQLNLAVKNRERQKAREINKKLDELPLPRNLAIGVKEAETVEHCRVNIGGDAHALGEEVPRGFVRVLFDESADFPAIPAGESGRLQLAGWLTRRDNPLTARVMVNRIWHHLFGRGIVPSVDNFGKTGRQATHPELLDYLAVQFMDQGWSVKSIIREMMLSRAYQLSTEFHAANYEKEPDNNLLWRMNRRRLEVEALRDAMLFVSGELNLGPPKESPVYGFKRNTQIRVNNKQLKPWELEENFRSVYVPVVRTQLNRFFETFDFPEPSETHGARDVTTVPTQALLLMNSKFVVRQGQAAAERLLASEPADEARVRRAFQQALSRNPTKDELERALEFVRAQMDSDGEETPEGSGVQQAWARLYHALFSSAEFRYRG